MKHWLVIYDIRDSKRLRKVAKCMESYGMRVQKSVFEIEAKEVTIEELRTRVNNIIDIEDFVVYFDVCEKDWQKMIKCGPGKFESHDEKEYYIL